MKRRDLLLTALVIPLLSVSGQRPLAADLQPARGTFRIGVLANLDTPDMEGLRQGLREHGYIDGSNVTVEWRWSQARSERLPALAAELVRAQPDIIVAVSTLAVTAAKDATPVRGRATVAVVAAARARLLSNASRCRGPGWAAAGW